MRSRWSPWCCVPVLLALAACNPHPLKDVELSRTAETVLDVDIAPLRNVDILFVIDNSGSMAAEQATLAANLAPLVEILEREDVAADYRIAVTTTDVDDRACTATGPEDGRFIDTSCRQRLDDFLTLPGFSDPEDARDSACNDICPESLTELGILPSRIDRNPDEEPRPWIENILGRTNLPEGVSTAQAFACMGPQGINGCGLEAPLRAMERALIRSDRNSEDEYGFLRDDAILLVVFVTDEADCSAAGAMPDQIKMEGNTGCWDAGVSCTENADGSLDCVSANHDLDGNAVDGDEAVLRPVEDYVAFLQAIEEDKREATGLDEVGVMVSLVAGVPTEFPDVPVSYTRDTEFVEEYGIDAGCISSFGSAAPPVRLLEFAEAFAPEEGSNVSSVCASSYSPALDAVARRLIENFEPECIDTCLAGGVGEDCVFTQDAPGESPAPVPQCEVAGDGSPRLPDDADACVFIAVDDARDPDCIAARAGAEFRPLYRAGVPRAAGTSISATCSISENAEAECPWTQG